MQDSLIWVDKYRPQTFEDILGQKHFILRIKSFIETKSLPHLLFAGSPGTGKTTTALVIAKELYGENGISGNVLELNASDERGIDVVRDTIKEFAKLKSLVVIPYKIIILDEADSLTREAQQALRRTMEKYSKTCRFILACNEISKIIDPIQSRCVIFKFKALKSEDLESLLDKIKKKENLTLSKEAKEMLINLSSGDMRKLVNTIQSTSSLNKSFGKKEVEEVLDCVNPKEVEELLNFAFKGDFLKARDYLIKLRIVRALSPLEILKEIYKNIIAKEIDPKLKIKLIDRIATCEFRLVEGSDPEIQIESLIAFFGVLQDK